MTLIVPGTLAHSTTSSRDSAVFTFMTAIFGLKGELSTAIINQFSVRSVLLLVIFLVLLEQVTLTLCEKQN